MKTWIGLLLIIYSSIFFIDQTNTIPNYSLSQNAYDFTVDPAIYNNKNVPMPSYVAKHNSLIPVLGETSDKKIIYIDLTNQRLYAFEGDNLIYDFSVSTGKWGRTPTGIFTIWSKFRYVNMSGGSVALHTYYNLPNVPYTQFFSNDKVPPSKGFGIHGTYWHNNFGHPMSHGCVNMRTSEAELLYRWTDPIVSETKQNAKPTKESPGTTVIIYGDTPSS